MLASPRLPREVSLPTDRCGQRARLKDIVKAPPSKRRLLAMLMAAAREVSALPIAEGIENETEASVCASAGFTLAQGYLFGRPLPLADLKKTDGRG